MKRRTVLKSIFAAMGTVLFWPARTARAAKIAIGLDKLSTLKTVGSSMTINLKGKTVMFVRDGEESVRGIDPTCTHQQCTTEYKVENNRIECPCHGSIFDLNGQVLKGPAEKPLNLYQTSLQDGRVVIDLQ